MSGRVEGMPSGLGTGLGSMPGTDPTETVRIVSGETDLCFVPELPARGVGADSVGRVGAILVDMPFDFVHDAYRLTARPGSVTRRARDFLARDLDALEEHWDAEGLIDTGRLLKVQVCGPFSYAARVELRNGHKMVRDRGAQLDIIGSMTDGLADHVRALERRLGARVVVQFDEPELESVLNGSVRPLTRLDPIPPIPISVVAQRLEEMAEAIARPMILRSGDAPCPGLFEQLRSFAMSVEVSRPLPDEDKDILAEYLDGGGVVVAGLVPTERPTTPISAEQIAQRVAAMTDELGLPRTVLRDGIVVTPRSGLAAAPSDWAVTALRLASQTAELLMQDPAAL